jgi:hypothetical protein
VPFGAHCVSMLTIDSHGGIVAPGVTVMLGEQTLLMYSPLAGVLDWRLKRDAFATVKMEASNIIEDFMILKVL